MIRVSGWEDWPEAGGGLEAAVVRAEQLPASGTVPAEWFERHALNKIAVLGRGPEVRVPEGCAVTLMPAGADSCDVICALGLKDEVRRQMRTMACRPLTDKERTVVDRSVHGRSYKEIADELGCTVSTVQSHKQRAMEKLEVTNLTDLTVCAAARGWRRCPCRSFSRDSLFHTS